MKELCSYSYSWNCFIIVVLHGNPYGSQCWSLARSTASLHSSERFEICGVSFQSEKSLKAPAGINCRVSGIDQPPFQPSADTLWR